MLQNFSTNITTIKMKRMFRPITDTPVTVFVSVATVIIWVALETNGSSTNSEDLFRWGAKDGNAVLNGDWWRTITSIFLHVGFLHLAFNMIALILFGSRVERIYGSSSYAMMYILAGVVGNLASVWTNPNLAAGASGALFGIVGAYGVYLLKNHKELGNPARRSLTWVVLIIAINIGGGVLQVIPNITIDNSGHIGGLIMGILLGIFLSPRVSLSIEWNSQISEATSAPIVVSKKRYAAWWIRLSSSLVYILVIALLFWLIISEILPTLW